MKKGRVTKRWMKRHIIVYEIIVSLLIVGGLYFGMRGSLCLALQTGEPFRAVDGSSMDHDDNIHRNEYIQNHGYDPYNTESWRDYFTQRGYDTSNFPFQGGFEEGDLTFVKGVNPFEDVRIGDVIIYTRPNDFPVIHRVVEITCDGGQIYFTTKGDNPYTNSNPDPRITSDRIISKVVFVIPKLGYLSLWWQGR
jgi:hypothetical protein